MNLRKCECGKLAQWLYMPYSELKHDPFFCDECVPRGCECQNRYVREPDLDDDDLPTADDLPFKWIVFGKSWKHVDDKGRDIPCVEYDYSEEGYNENENEEEIEKT
jgi:hypothetical protein